MLIIDEVRAKIEVMNKIFAGIFTIPFLFLLSGCDETIDPPTNEEIEMSQSRVFKVTNAIHGVKEIKYSLSSDGYKIAPGEKVAMYQSSKEMAYKGSWSNLESKIYLLENIFRNEKDLVEFKSDDEVEGGKHLVFYRKVKGNSLDSLKSGAGNLDLEALKLLNDESVQESSIEQVILPMKRNRLDGDVSALRIIHLSNGLQAKYPEGIGIYSKKMMVDMPLDHSFDPAKIFKLKIGDYGPIEKDNYLFVKPGQYYIYGLTENDSPQEQNQLGSFVLEKKHAYLVLILENKNSQSNEYHIQLIQEPVY